MANLTPLFNIHASLCANMSSFAGWKMPIYYTSIKDEHNSVRNNAGLFDIGHMGAIKVAGKNALQFIQKVLSNDASRLTNGSSQYSLFLNENGGVIDDIFVYKINDFFMLIVNAANAEKDMAWLKQNRTKDVELWDLKDKMTLLALQGPRSQEILQSIINIDLNQVGHHKIVSGKISDIDCMVSRSGYTGEDGFELFFDKRKAEKIWNLLLDNGKEKGLLPCGLGARDTLRLEAGLPLYGHEYDEDTTPFEAGYSFVVKFEKEGDFIGKEALLKQKKEGIRKKLVGIKMLEKMIPRQGYTVFINNEEVGKVASGTLSPTLGYPIATCYIKAEKAEVGMMLDVEIRDNKYPAEIVKLPFYKKA